ncbi:MAG TPA: hypothetical protein VI893_02630 [Thermoplasmata archaeon]|nr:hypothetical protein [Thermoplasmata archaeon]
MAKSIMAIEKAFDSGTRDLHEFLWGGGGAGEPAALERRLVGLSKDLDSHIGAKGALAAAAGSLVKPLRKDGAAGPKYFTLIETVGDLALARAAYAKRDHEKCARLSHAAVTNLTISMLAAAGRFDVVEEYEHKLADAKVYIEKAVDALQSAGAKTADRWMRIFLLTHAAKETVPQLTDAASKRLGANAALALAAVAVVRFNAISGEIGRFDEAVFSKFPEFAAAAALGRQ